MNGPPMAGGSGFPTLLYKELLRFWKVSAQTVTAPILTALLYLVIFSHVLQDRVQVYPGVAYTAFLVPGLVMMSILQNAFANSSSSLIQSKVTGNLVFVLLPPIAHVEFFAAYVIAAIVRGVCVGSGVFVVTLLFAWPPLKAPLWILAFALLGSALMGAVGLLAGLLAERRHEHRRHGDHGADAPPAGRLLDRPDRADRRQPKLACGGCGALSGAVA